MMNRRYVEAMARAAARKLWNEGPTSDDHHYAKTMLAALIAHLRADPGAVEAIVDRMPFVPRDEAGRVLSALCDYLAGDG